jgi:hypothetical protein
MDDKPTYQVTLQALPSSVPARIRLRRFLKTALRAFALRAVSVRELPAGGAGAAGERGPESWQESTHA